ncbi:MAG: hypothetical protein VW988_03035 [Gammaproteobacteria bacterium]|jgi:hypothetical protein|nr:hypothetical protein [Paracoccaceae bacterium]|tara:strand:+ start:51 stop:491 length:441 start_codon:yes stop_codon:yes gene_type:complete
MPQSTDLISSIQDQFVDIIEVYANYFVKLSAKNHSPKNITVAVFKANIENLEKFRIKELKKLNDKDIEKKFNPTSINYISRSLDVPRETIRRNILTLVDNSELIRSDEGLFVSEKWIKKNIDKIISEVIDLIDKSNDLTKKIDRKS